MAMRPDRQRPDHDADGGHDTPRPHPDGQEHGGGQIRHPDHEVGEQAGEDGPAEGGRHVAPEAPVRPESTLRARSRRTTSSIWRSPPSMNFGPVASRNRSSTNVMRKDTPREAADWMAATSSPPRSRSGELVDEGVHPVPKLDLPGELAKRSDRSTSPAARREMTLHPVQLIAEVVHHHVGHRPERSRGDERGRRSTARPSGQEALEQGTNGPSRAAPSTATRASRADGWPPGRRPARAGSRPPCPRPG